LPASRPELKQWLWSWSSIGYIGSPDWWKNWYLGETGPLNQGVHAGRKALRIRHTSINGMEVRKKRPRGFK
jgi:hypothetical protein